MGSLLRRKHGWSFFPPHSPLLPSLPLWLSAWHLYPELQFLSSLRYTLSAIRHLLDRVHVAQTTTPIQWELLLAVLQDGSRIRSFSHFQGYTWVSARTLAPTSLICCHTCLYSLFCAQQSVIPLKCKFTKWLTNANFSYKCIPGNKWRKSNRVPRVTVVKRPLGGCWHHTVKQPAFLVLLMKVLPPPSMFGPRRWAPNLSEPLVLTPNL